MGKLTMNRAILAALYHSPFPFGYYPVFFPPITQELSSLEYSLLGLSVRNGVDLHHFHMPNILYHNSTPVVSFPNKLKEFFLLWVFYW